LRAAESLGTDLKNFNMLEIHKDAELSKEWTEIKDEITKLAGELTPEKEHPNKEIDLNKTIRGNITGKYSMEFRLPKEVRDIFGITEKTEFNVLVNTEKEEVILRIKRPAGEKGTKNRLTEVTVISVKRKE